MKKNLISIAMLLATCGTSAQVTVAEPEFINSYNILTSNTTYDVLPKENGTIQEHKNKTSLVSAIGRAAKDVGRTIVVAGGGMMGSASTVMDGLKVMTMADGVGSAAEAVNILAGAEGMDIVFDGGHSSYQTAKGQEVRLLIRAENNETDPMELYRIVRFNASKKDRRVQWMEFRSALIGSKDAQKAGYVAFTGHKYGLQSYLLTIPASEMEKGEYGIFYMNITTATAIPVGTFGVK